MAVGEDNSEVFTLRLGGGRVVVVVVVVVDPKGRVKEVVVGDAEVIVNTGGVSFEVGEEGVIFSVEEGKLRVYPLGAA